MELKDLNEKIVEWAVERKLDKEAKVEAQSVKTCEEFSELVRCICDPCSRQSHRQIY